MCHLPHHVRTKRAPVLWSVQGIRLTVVDHSNHVLSPLVGKGVASDHEPRIAHPCPLATPSANCCCTNRCTVRRSTPHLELRRVLVGSAQGDLCPAGSVNEYAWTKKHACPPGMICPNRTAAEPCKEGWFCPLGSFTYLDVLEVGLSRRGGGGVEGVSF